MKNFGKRIRSNYPDLDELSQYDILAALPKSCRQLGARASLAVSHRLFRSSAQPRLYTPHTYSHTRHCLSKSDRIPAVGGSFTTKELWVQQPPQPSRERFQLLHIGPVLLEMTQDI